MMSCSRNVKLNATGLAPVSLFVIAFAFAAYLVVKMSERREKP
jgi:hypothetical protein